nr:PREDICTED: uncharacterized protein LOC109039607 [Bemisia tabaci]
MVNSVLSQSSCLFSNGSKCAFASFPLDSSNRTAMNSRVSSVFRNYLNFNMKSILSSFVNRMILFVSIFCTTFVSVKSAVTWAPSVGECGEEMLTKCRYPLKVLAENKELGFATNKEDLDLICPDLNDGLMCIDNYTRRCMAPNQRAHFYQLYAGTSMVIQEICQPGPYQNEFLLHAPCLHEVKEEYEACGINHQKNIHDITADTNSTNHITNERKVRKLCCSFQEYLQCSQEVVLKKCGEETAKFMEVFFAKMSSSLIQIHCSKYTPGSQLCDEAFSSATSVSSSSLLATLAVSLSILYSLRRCLCL